MIKRIKCANMVTSYWEVGKKEIRNLQQLHIVILSSGLWSHEELAKWTD